MRRVTMVLVSLGVLCAASAGWAQVELLTNAGFETGDLTGWTTTSTHSGTAVVVTGAGAGACDPGGADTGTSWVSFSTDDGAAGLPAGSSGEIRVEQTHDVSAFATSIDAGLATVDLATATTSVECMPSPDLANVEVEFYSATPPTGLLGTSGTTPARPPDSVWAPISSGSIAVPVSTRFLVFRYVSTLGASGTSVGIGGDTMSASFTPVELQSFSIE